MSQPTVDKLKLQRQPLKGALQALHGLASNLSFTQSCTSEALAMVAEKKKFNLDRDALRDYQQRTTARLRLACRHVSQAMCKNPRAVWVKEMFGDLNIACPAEPQLENQVRQCSCTKLVLARSRSLEKLVVGSRKHAMETTFDVFTEGNDETLGAWDRWSTEPPVQLPSEVLTAGTVMQWRSSARKKAPTWESHTTTGDRVWVARRKDRFCDCGHVGRRFKASVSVYDNEVSR